MKTRIPGAGRAIRGTSRRPARRFPFSRRGAHFTRRVDRLRVARGAAFAPSVSRARAPLIIHARIGSSFSQSCTVGMNPRSSSTCCSPRSLVGLPCHPTSGRSPRRRPAARGTPRTRNGGSTGVGHQAGAPSPGRTIRGSRGSRSRFRRIAWRWTLRGSEGETCEGRAASVSPSGDLGAGRAPTRSGTRRWRTRASIRSRSRVEDPRPPW